MATGCKVLSIITNCVKIINGIYSTILVKLDGESGFKCRLTAL